ncbi:MAG: hypothetical protein OEZ06_14175 [Myxococcales bacterium]|nr:hypothetical protein [Myxococcales bacterium]
MKKRWLIAIAVLGLWALLLVDFSKRRPRQAPDAASNLEQEAELAAPSPEPPTARRPLEQPEPVAEDGPSEQETPPPEPLPSSRLRLLRRALESEPRDTLWADGAEVEAKRVLSDEELPEDLVQSVHCRKRVCKLELRWSREGSSGYRRFSALVAEHWGPHLGIEYLPESRAERRINLYILRDGYTIGDLVE